MIILNQSQRNPSNIQPSEITPREVFDHRRSFLKAAGYGLATGSALFLSGKTQAANIANGATEGAGRLV
ncbi:MAG: protein-methionine-sulfoxide reductase catalytic subunit MsrP, partial [Pseudomonadota bacterium]